MKSIREIAEPEEVEYMTRVDVNIAILREIERIHFREKLRGLMPLVASQLVAAGVDFSKVDFSTITDATDAEIDQVFDFVSSAKVISHDS